MRYVVASLLVVLLSAWAATAAEYRIDATGEADGKTVLWFNGAQVKVQVDSALVVTGSLDLAGDRVAFTAVGTAWGQGIGDSSTFRLDLWLLFDAAGETERGIPIRLRGGMAGSSRDTDLAIGEIGSASGPFFFLVSHGTETYRVLGTANGRAAGAFVVPDDPLTMQMEGVASYTLSGDLIRQADLPDPVSDLEFPWDSASWPPELLDELFDLLHGLPPTSSDDPPPAP